MFGQSNSSTPKLVINVCSVCWWTEQIAGPEIGPPWRPSRRGQRSQENRPKRGTQAHHERIGEDCKLTSKPPIPKIYLFWRLWKINATVNPRCKYQWTPLRSNLQTPLGVVYLPVVRDPLAVVLGPTARQGCCLIHSHSMKYTITYNMLQKWYTWIQHYIRYQYLMSQPFAFVTLFSKWNMKTEIDIYQRWFVRSTKILYSDVTGEIQSLFMLSAWCPICTIGFQS